MLIEGATGDRLFCHRLWVPTDAGEVVLVGVVSVLWPVGAGLVTPWLWPWGR